ncbi:MAG: DUF4242 domain-containing protein [Chloroflexi bacterium]|nr:DUF4242 domain-containing protein [Chloroflexota bacterium]
MSLYLLEYGLTASDRAEVERALETLAAAIHQAAGTLIEAQVATDLGRLYVVVEHEQGEALAVALALVDLSPHEIAPVRLVGATVEEVKAAAGLQARYLVEWDLPAGLTMDQYLARKAAKSPRYAEVPEVRFLRTYVREDLAKCLCFYAAPDEAAVRRARAVVEAPIDRLTRLAERTRAVV